MDPDTDMNVSRFKVKKLITSLEAARGAGTSVITLYVPPKQQIAQTTQMLNVELGTCSNIKSHTNKLSVQSAITSTLGRLKLFNKVPTNGLILYCGTVLTEDNKEKKITLDIEPFKPVSRSLYLCDNKFHTEELKRMLDSDEKYGFIVVDGNGVFYATVCGDVTTKLDSFTLERPTKIDRAGRSKRRTARVRMARRHNYLRKVAETATGYFITDSKPNVAGLVLAGSAGIKESLYMSDMFDPRLKERVVKLVDVAHSGDVGLNQAIDLSQDALGNVKLVQEQKLIRKFFDEIGQDSNLYCYGVIDSMKALEMGAIETLILFEDLDVKRYVVRPADGGAEETHFLTEREAARKNPPLTYCEGSQANNEVESMDLVDYLAENYKKFGCTLELITDKSQEGMQFVKGFGGMGGILRYKVDLVQLNELEQGVGNQKLSMADIEEGDDLCLS